jgi:hypothetical protein
MVKLQSALEKNNNVKKAVLYILVIPKIVLGRYLEINSTQSSDVLHGRIKELTYQSSG